MGLLLTERPRTQHASRHPSIPRVRPTFPFPHRFAPSTYRTLTFDRTRKDVVLPLSKPIPGLNNQPVSEIPLSKDTVVVVSLLNANRNPDIWGPDAMEWKPERWLGELPSSVTEAKIPGVYSNL